MNPLKRLSPIALALALVFGFTAAARAQSQGQAFDQLPANTLVVVHVRNLQDLSTKIANLAQQWGVADLVPEMADPLAAAEKHLGLEKGIDKSGDAAIAFVDADAAGGSPDKAMLALIPVTDYDAFATNFHNTQADGAISQGTAGPGEQPVFFTHWGKYAAVSPAKELLAKAGTGVTLKGLTAKEAAAKDILLYANFGVIRDKFLPQLKANRDKIVAEAEQQVQKGGADTKAFIPLVHAVVNQALNVAEGFLRDAQAATWGLNITTSGINTTMVMEFTPDTYSGNAVAKIQNSDSTFLAELPDQKFLFYGGNVASPNVFPQLADDLLDPIMKEVGALGDNSKPIITYVGALKAMLRASTSSTMGMVAPTGPLGQEGLFQLIAISRGDAKALASAQRDMFNSQQEIMKAFNVKNADKTHTTFTANAKTVAGVSFDQFQTQFNLNPQTPQDAQAAQFITFLYGPNGLNGYNAVLDDKHFATVMGGNDALLEAVVDSVKKNIDPLGQSDGVKAVAGQLPKTRAIAGYVAIDNLVSTGLNYARQFGLPVQLQLPPNLPPIGIAAGTEGSALRFDTHVPSQLVQSLIAAGMQVMMQMHGGGGPQQGGPNAQPAPGGGGL